MIYKLYIILIIITILFTHYQFYKNKFDRRKRKNVEIIILNKNYLNFNLIAGLAYFIFFIIFTVLFTYEIHRMYYKDYINSIFQLFSYEYLENLRIVFYENNMVSQLCNIVVYQKAFLNYMFWINFSLCFFILNFYIGWQKNIIYEMGILVNGSVIKWDEVIDYNWSNSYERKKFDKGEYYDLILTLPKFYDLDHEVKLRVNYDDKELVNDIFKKYTNKGNNNI